MIRRRGKLYASAGGVVGTRYGYVGACYIVLIRWGYGLGLYTTTIDATSRCKFFRAYGKGARTATGATSIVGAAIVLYTYGVLFRGFGYFVTYNGVGTNVDVEF